MIAPGAEQLRENGGFKKRSILSQNSVKLNSETEDVCFGVQKNMVAEMLSGG